MKPRMCGIFGIYGHAEAANLTYLGLHALQHRGQESAGIVSSDGQRLFAHRAMGLVQAVFSPPDLAALPGSSAIGHVRYSTAGGSHLKNVQPLAVDYARGSIAVDERTNILIARDISGNLNNIEELIRSLDTQTPQVLVEARIVEATSRYLRDVGIQWGGDVTFTEATGNPTSKKVS